jgi:thioester reductase-like protein
MGSQIFMTGFPGFISKNLVGALLEKEPEAGFTFLIEERMRAVAEGTIEALGRAHPGLPSRARFVAGDISARRLGLSQEVYEAEAAATTHVLHSAAIYNLSVPASIAYRVNVVGTANVLDFCEACRGLKRLDYISTCYVCGDRTGLILESELDEGQGFKNHYESTKCWAELEVRRRAHRIPTAIHRPGIVVGDSKTGETDKYDGPYFLINLLSKVPAWLPMAHIGEGMAPVNLVPIDFLVRAMATVWQKDEALGQTVALADPYPHTAREIMEGILSALGFKRPAVALPPKLIEGILGIGKLRSLLKVPMESVTYFNHEVHFDTANQRRLLKGTGLSCPDILTVIPTMVEYVKAHPDKPFLDGRTI